MKASELLKLLESVVENHGDVVVDLNNGHGIYESIIDAKATSWMDSNGLHHFVIELLHDGSYDKKESCVAW